jgi:hypothetical protein
VGPVGRQRGAPEAACHALFRSADRITGRRESRRCTPLPGILQYGVGSAGFGARREPAAHIMTTKWVLGNEYAGFPLMYHWRVLPDSPRAGERRRVALPLGG